MRNTILLITFLALVAMGLWLWSFQRNQAQVEPDLNVLKVGETMVNVEIADSFEEWSQGLSGREGLDEDRGMLFVSPDSISRSFWMKEMRFPLDMLFIDAGMVVEIARAVPVPSEGQDGTEIKIVSQEKAAWVLEVNSGWANRHGIEVGDEVSFQ